MISIQEKTRCCGCGACVQACPRNCISLKDDQEGFLYPFVNQDECIKCKVCTKVCPMQNTWSPQKPLKLFVAVNSNDNIRLASSSGGVFSLFADLFLKENGVVYGAAFDSNWEVHHIRIESPEYLHLLRGSKYIQSKIENTYKDVECDLKKGRQVLFSGTPCQIAGLQSFLRKKYDSLATLDFICHGVPSPGVWRKYLKENLKKFDIKSISFRDKFYGWKLFSICFEMKNKIFREKALRNAFMRLFILDNLTIRPSCYNCFFKNGKSNSDITIADFWSVKKIKPEFDDNRGASAVLCNTSKGMDLFKKITCMYEQVDFDKIRVFNNSYSQSVTEPANRDAFWEYLRNNSVNKAALKFSYTMKGRFKRSIRVFLEFIGVKL